MIFNVGFWEQFIRNQLMRQTAIFIESIENRLLPTFHDIESEAEKVQEQEWDRLSSLCTSPNIDPSDLAEKAHNAGLDYYELVSGVKQSLLNVSSASLYHLFEQQLLFFLRREILHPSEENSIDLMKVSIFKERCLQHNLDVEKFSSWHTIDEMRLVANTVKHAEGKSAADLFKIRPDLFTNPVLVKYGTKIGGSSKRVYMPLAGKDLYLSIEELKKYGEAIVQFWNEMIAAMKDRI